MLITHPSLISWIEERKIDNNEKMYRKLEKKVKVDKKIWKEIELQQQELAELW